jgi:hypothetical protein
MSFYSFSYFIRNFNFKLGGSLHSQVDLVRRHSRVVCMCGKFVGPRQGAKFIQENTFLGGGGGGACPPKDFEF